jgi:hypothetical protein
LPEQAKHYYKLLSKLRKPFCEFSFNYLRGVKSQRSLIIEKDVGSSLRSAVTSLDILELPPTPTKSSESILVYNQDATQMSIHLPLLNGQTMATATIGGIFGAKAKVLFDTGASGFFVSKTSPILNSLVKFKHAQPRQLFMFDGRESIHGLTTCHDHVATNQAQRSHNHSYEFRRDSYEFR